MELDQRFPRRSLRVSTLLFPCPHSCIDYCFHDAGVGEEADEACCQRLPRLRSEIPVEWTRGGDIEFVVSHPCAGKKAHGWGTGLHPRLNERAGGRERSRHLHFAGALGAENQ